MGNKVTTLYDFTLTANGSQQIQADANFYKILTASGDVSITRDGGSTVKPMRAGRGERNVQFLTLTIRDLSGAPNSGTILVGDSDFIDDTIVLSSAINLRPEAISGFYASTVALAAVSSTPVFLPGANTGGAIVMSAEFLSINAGAVAVNSYVANTAAPANAADGDVICQTTSSGAGGATHAMGSLKNSAFIPAGKGLYYFNTTAETGALRSCRYKLL